MKKPRHPKLALFLHRLKLYGVGLGMGALCAVYGLVALWMKSTFLPGIKTMNSMVTGAHGAAVAVAYLAGGVYLLCRFFLHERIQRATVRAQLYLIENVLLIILIAALGYVLWQVGAVG